MTCPPVSYYYNIADKPAVADSSCSDIDRSPSIIIVHDDDCAFSGSAESLKCQIL